MFDCTEYIFFLIVAHCCFFPIALCMASSQSQSELFVTKRVVHGSGFDLDCHVNSNTDSTIYWYIVTDSNAEEKIYIYLSGSDIGETGNENDHLDGRDANAVRLSDTVYRLHIEEADKTKDTATYLCEREFELRSEEKSVYVYSKLKL